MDINLYCNCYKDSVNKRSEYNQKNLMLGSIDYNPELKERLRKQGYLFDDTGDNISDLNHWFGQCTGLYWTWKNADHEIVGTNTYRIFWGDYFLKNEFEKNTLYIREKIEWKSESIYQQFARIHGHEGLDMLYELSLNNDIPLTPTMVDSLKHQNFLHACNMFISEKPIFDKTCSIYFETMFKFYTSYKDRLPEIEQYGRKRLLDYLGERVFHIIYMNAEYFLGNVNIKTGTS